MNELCPNCRSRPIQQGGTLCWDCEFHRLVTLTRTPAEVVALIADIGNLGETRRGRAVSSFGRGLQSDIEWAEAVFGDGPLQLNAPQQSENPPVTPATTRHAVHRIEQMLHKRVSSIVFEAEGINDGLVDRVRNPYLVEVATMLESLGPQANVADLLGAASTGEYIAPWLRPLLGEDLTLDDVLNAPNGGELHKISARDFAFGLARLRECALALEGHTPPDIFTAAERELYDRFEPAHLRRARRALDTLESIDLARSNDRSEELFRLWVMHPIGSPIRDYLPILHRAYSDGHDAAAVIICRSILENAVNATGGEQLDPGTAASVPKRIRELKRRGVLSPTATQKALDVWYRGNKVVHVSPAFVNSVRGTISITFEVLDELAPHIRPGAQNPNIDE